MVLLLALALGAALWLWLHQPLPLNNPEGPTRVLVPPGSSARQVANAMVAAGVQTPAWALNAWLRLSGASRQIHAGTYEIAPGTTPLRLRQQLVLGEVAVGRVRLIEGWTFRQVRRALAEAEALDDDLGTHSDQALMARLDREGLLPEGRFFPDTYSYPLGGSALDVLRQAADALDRQLAQAWAERAPDLPLRSPEEALILASLVEKETGHEADRVRVAEVFVNRLRIGMRLQTDPSVIYGMGEAFDGNLRRRDLETDTPYNTYTRAGLPPTPIALPSLASLRAALHPARGDALYFVARGDGRSQFSRTLGEHNAAVQQYQIRRRAAP